MTGVRSVENQAIVLLVIAQSIHLKCTFVNVENMYMGIYRPANSILKRLICNIKIYDIHSKMCKFD